MSCFFAAPLECFPGWLEAHFLNVNPVWSRDTSCCTLIASSTFEVPLSHQRKNHSSAREQTLGIDTCCHLLTSLGNMLPDMELKMFRMSWWWGYTLEWVRQKNGSIEFFVDPCSVDVQLPVTSLLSAVKHTWWLLNRSTVEYRSCWTGPIGSLGISIEYSSSFCGGTCCLEDWMM